MNISFGPLQEKYLDSLAALEQQCFSVPWSRAQFAEELTNPLARYWVVTDNAVVIAYGGLWQVCGDGQITNIAVLPGYRRQGIARVIVEEMSKFGEENGLFQLTLEVREGNHAARGLYTACGFIEVGSRPGYYTDNKETAILMTKPLGGDTLGTGAGH